MRLEIFDEVNHTSSAMSFLIPNTVKEIIMI